MRHTNYLYLFWRNILMCNTKRKQRQKFIYSNFNSKDSFSALDSLFIRFWRKHSVLLCCFFCVYIILSVAKAWRDTYTVRPVCIAYTHLNRTIRRMCNTTDSGYLVWFLFFTVFGLAQWLFFLFSQLHISLAFLNKIYINNKNNVPGVRHLNAWCCWWTKACRTKTHCCNPLFCSVLVNSIQIFVCHVPKLELLQSKWIAPAVAYTEIRPIQ